MRLNVTFKSILCANSEKDKTVDVPHPIDLKIFVKFVNITVHKYI